MESNVSVKNTKNQILDAYNDLLQKLQVQRTEEPKKVQEQKKKEELVGSAKLLSNEGIVKGIAELKVNLSSALDQLGDKFVSEYKNFEELQQAINVEKQNLEDLYQLSANTDSLAVMLLAQKEKREQFEIEMNERKLVLTEKINLENEKHGTDIQEKRAIWKKEQEEQSLTAKENIVKTKKEREREIEEYQYNLNINRKKESDQYEEKKQKLEKELTEKKTAFEKEFQERKTKIAEAETELLELRKTNTAFPAEIEKAVNAAVEAETEKLQSVHQFEKELKETEVEGELKLKAQTIDTLNTKIKEMETAIKDMSQKTITAESSVKDIAIKAIESSSKPYYIENPKANSTSE